MADVRTSVYRFYDEYDLLYVGITSNFESRLRQHRRKCRAFISEAIVVTVCEYKDRFTAERVEATAIAQENPVYNVQQGKRDARAHPAIEGPELWSFEVDYFERWLVA